MLYLSEFSFPDEETEVSFRMSIKRTCYDTMYPFFVLSKKEVRRLEFEPVTILYGGNGSGKTTALNVIAEKLALVRDALYNRSSFFGDYVGLCRHELRSPVPIHSRIITSDDVFDFMLGLRSLNEGIDLRREELFKEYLDNQHREFRVSSLDDYEELKKINRARSKTQSRFVREYLKENVREHSNGESAYLYFTDKIRDDGLYLLDEPENSLSPAKQQELVRFMEDSARFFGCQFIIATHSPFLLAMRGARIYDLDETPAEIRRWTELPGVRDYFEFFEKHRHSFIEEEY